MLALLTIVLPLNTPHKCITRQGAYIGLCLDHVVEVVGFIMKSCTHPVMTDVAMDVFSVGPP